jgi:hypothetical protein
MTKEAESILLSDEKITTIINNVPTFGQKALSILIARATAIHAV